MYGISMHLAKNENVLSGVKQTRKETHTHTHIQNPTLTFGESKDLSKKKKREQQLYV